MDSKEIFEHIGSGQTVCPFAAGVVKDSQLLSLTIGNPSLEGRKPNNNYINQLDNFIKGTDKDLVIILNDIPKSISFENLVRNYLVGYKTKVTIGLFAAKYPIILEKQENKLKIIKNSIDKKIFKNIAEYLFLENIGISPIKELSEITSLFIESLKQDIDQTILSIGPDNSDKYLLTYMGPQYHNKHGRYMPHSSIVIVKMSHFKDTTDDMRSKIRKTIEKRHKEYNLPTYSTDKFVVPY